MRQKRWQADLLPFLPQICEIATKNVAAFLP